MSDPNLSDIDFKNKMAWVLTTLNELTPLILESNIETKSIRVVRTRGHVHVRVNTESILLETH